MRHIAAALLLALPGVLSAQPNCGITSKVSISPGDSIAPVERLVAIVGDRYVLCSEVWGDYMRRVNNTPPADSAEMMKQLRGVVDEYVESEMLIYLALLQSFDLPVDDVERALDARIAQLRGQFNGDENRFVAELKSAGFGSVESLRKNLEDNLRRSELPQRFILDLRSNGKLPAAPVPDSVINQQLPKLREARGRRPEMISFRQIFLPTQPSPQEELAARARADSLVARLQKGEDFAELAKAVSADSATRNLGGDLGWKRRNAFYPEFERWVFSASPGQISHPIRTPAGYHIAKVERVQSAQVLARHIVVRPVLDSADVARNRALADSIVKELRAGAKFDSLADKFSDPTLRGQRVIPSQRRDSLEILFPDYATGLKDLKVGEVSNPFAIRDARSEMPTYVIAIVTGIEPARDYTDDELKEELRRNLQTTAAIRAYLDRMKKQVYIRIFM